MLANLKMFFEGFGATIVYVTGYGYAASHKNTTFYVVLLQTAYGVGFTFLMLYISFKIEALALVHPTVRQSLKLSVMRLRFIF